MAISLRSLNLPLETTELDDRSWVYDFGEFKVIQDWIKDHFDHTLVVSSDDPEFDSFKESWRYTRDCKSSRNGERRL